MNKVMITLASIAFLISCSTAKLSSPTQADVDRVKSTYPDYTMAELKQGQDLYDQKCANCHSLKKPSSRTAEQWNKIVPSMTNKANKKGINIDPKQQELILRYLTTMCSAPTK